MDVGRKYFKLELWKAMDSVESNECNFFSSGGKMIS